MVIEHILDLAEYPSVFIYVLFITAQKSFNLHFHRVVLHEILLGFFSQKQKKKLLGNYLLDWAFEITFNFF